MRRLVTLGAVVEMLLVGLVAVAGPAQAKVPGPNGEILFTRFDAALDDGVLYTMNPDGSHLHQVASVPVECPHWSADGSQIATCGAPDGGTSLIINPDTGTYRELYADPTLFLACNVWSPNARRLACDQFQSRADPDQNGMYTIRSSDGGGPQRVTTNPGGEDVPFDYSPDGSRIVFDRVDATRPPRSSQAVFVVNIDGTGLQRITPWGSSLDMTAGWSPDGTKILFSRNGSLFTVHPDGTHLTNIPLAGINGWAYAFQPGWSPDGTKIVFGLVTKTAPNGGVFTAIADGTDVQQLTNSPTGGDDSQEWGPHTLAT
jgi:Tol biopolymer transport system component